MESGTSSLAVCSDEEEVAMSVDESTLGTGRRWRGGLGSGESEAVSSGEGKRLRKRTGGAKKTLDRKSDEKDEDEDEEEESRGKCVEAVKVDKRFGVELEGMELEAKRKKMREESLAGLRKMREDEEGRKRDVESKKKKKKEEEECAKKDDEGSMTRRVDVMGMNLARVVGAMSGESGGKISVTRADQDVAKEAIFEVQQGVVSILARQMELEGENNRLKEELRESLGAGRSGARVQPGRVEESSSGGGGGDPSDWSVMRRRRGISYAEAAKGAKVGARVEGGVVVVGKEGWKTPPPVRSQGSVLVVSSRGDVGKDGDLKNALAKGIKAKDIGGPPQQVRVGREGRVIVVARDEEQKKKIVDRVNSMGNMDVREGRRKDPLVLITGLEKGMPDGELLGKIERGCEGLKLGDSKEMRVVKRYGCANPWKENVVISAGVEIFKRIVKVGRVEIDCELRYAEEYLGTPMCFRCCRFGHVAKFCREKAVCGECMGEHESRECREGDKKRCANCWRMFGERANHAARDPRCPAMRKVLEKSRKFINYRNE